MQGPGAAQRNGRRVARGFAPFCHPRRFLGLFLAFFAPAEGMDRHRGDSAVPLHMFECTIPQAGAARCRGDETSSGNPEIKCASVEVRGGFRLSPDSRVPGDGDQFYILQRRASGTSAQTVLWLHRPSILS